MNWVNTKACCPQAPADDGCGGQRRSTEDRHRLVAATGDPTSRCSEIRLRAWTAAQSLSWTGRQPAWRRTESPLTASPRPPHHRADGGRPPEPHDAAHGFPAPRSSSKSKYVTATNLAHTRWTSRPGGLSPACNETWPTSSPPWLTSRYPAARPSHTAWSRAPDRRKWSLSPAALPRRIAQRAPAGIAESVALYEAVVARPGACRAAGLRHRERGPTDSDLRVARGG